MPKIAYSDQQKAEIKANLIKVGLELMAKQGIQHTTTEQIYKKVGISKTFFYSFFPTKEDLVIEALYYQQPKILAHLQELLANPNLSYKQAVKQFLHQCCYGNEYGIAVLTIEEQQHLFKRLSKESYQIFRQKQIQLFDDFLKCLEIKADIATINLFTNLILSVMVIKRAIPDALPFLVPEAAKQMVDFQINAIVDALDNLRNQ